MNKGSHDKYEEGASDDGEGDANEDNAGLDGEDYDDEGNDQTKTKTPSDEEGSGLSVKERRAHSTLCTAHLRLRTGICLEGFYHRAALQGLMRLFSSGLGDQVSRFHHW
ncbi:hypothetical protein MTO96_035254 [Rhipicephalus appendiculatus]